MKFGESSNKLAGYISVSFTRTTQLLPKKAAAVASIVLHLISSATELSSDLPFQTWVLLNVIISSKTGISNTNTFQSDV